MLTKKDRESSYVYVYLDPRKPGLYVYGEYRFNYEPFYVGKGWWYRDRSHLHEAERKKGGDHPKIAKIQKVWAAGLDPVIDYPLINATDDQACSVEKELISLIGRRDLNLGPLTNLSDGGEASTLGSHFKNRSGPSEETKKKISETLKQKYKEDPSLREKASQQIKNYYSDPTARQKAGDTHRGIKQSAENIEKRRQGLLKSYAEGTAKGTKGKKGEWHLDAEQRKEISKRMKQKKMPTGCDSRRWKGWLLDVSNNISYVTAKVAAKRLQISPGAITWRLKNQPELWKYTQTPSSIQILE